MSIFARAWHSTYNYFAGRREPAKIILLGLDAAGKTTFLYKVASAQSRLYPAEIVTTIPTIGFNVESMVLQSSMKFMCWDIGGCDKVRPLWRHYMQDVGALVFFIDSNDRDRWSDAKTEMDLFFGEEDLRGVPVLVVANKCDLPNAMTQEEIVHKLNLNAIRDRDWHIIPACVVDGTGVSQILQWIDGAARKARVKPTTPTDLQLGKETAPEASNKPAISYPTTVLDMAAVLSSAPPVPRSVQEDWMERVDEPEGEFLAELHSFQLDIWDHYTHVRIAWVLIKNHGIREGFAAIETALRSFIENSSRTDSRSFHATMTRFWCHMIAYSMELVVWESKAPRGGDFKQFIHALCAPNSVIGQHAPLWDKALFKRYYSSNAMFKAEARTVASPPDLQALPDIVAIMSDPPLDGASDVFRSDTDFLEQSTYWKLSAV